MKGRERALMIAKRKAKGKPARLKALADLAEAYDRKQDERGSEPDTCSTAIIRTYRCDNATSVRDVIP